MNQLTVRVNIDTAYPQTTVSIYPVHTLEHPPSGRSVCMIDDLVFRQGAICQIYEPCWQATSTSGKHEVSNCNDIFDQTSVFLNNG